MNVNNLKDSDSVSELSAVARPQALLSKLVNIFSGALTSNKSNSSISFAGTLDEQQIRARLLAAAKKNLPSYVPEIAEKKIFVPIQNDVKQARGYLALFFCNLQKDETIRMTFGHLPKLLLEDGIDFSQCLAMVKNKTSDFKIMCLDYRYAEILLDLRAKFAAGMEASDEAVQDKLNEAKAISPSASAISAKFMQSFIKEFGEENFFINTNEKIAHIPRTWSFGKSGFRITTGNIELDLQKELHDADVNFGDSSAAKFSKDVFEHYCEQEYIK